MKIENLELHLLKNLIIEEPKLIMNYQELLERSEFLRNLKESITKDDGNKEVEQ